MTDQTPAPEPCPPLTQTARRELAALLDDQANLPDHQVVFAIMGRGPYFPDRDDWEGCRIVGEGVTALRTIARLTNGGTRSPAAQAMLAQVERAWSDLATPPVMAKLRRAYQRRLDQAQAQAQQTSDNAVRMIALSLLNTYQRATGTLPSRLETLLPIDQRPWYRLAEFVAMSTPLHGLFHLVLVSTSNDDPSDDLGQTNDRGIQSDEPDQDAQEDGAR